MVGLGLGLGSAIKDFVSLYSKINCTKYYCLWVFLIEPSFRGWVWADLVMTMCFSWDFLSVRSLFRTWLWLVLSIIWNPIPDAIHFTQMIWPPLNSLLCQDSIIRRYRRPSNSSAWSWRLLLLHSFEKWSTSPELSRWVIAPLISIENCAPQSKCKNTTTAVQNLIADHRAQLCAKIEIVQCFEVFQLKKVHRPPRLLVKDTVWEVVWEMIRHPMTFLSTLKCKLGDQLCSGISCMRKSRLWSTQYWIRLLNSPVGLPMNETATQTS